MDPSGKVSAVDREKPSGMFVIGERAGFTRIMRRSAEDIRFRLVDTFLATNPFEASGADNHVRYWREDTHADRAGYRFGQSRA